MEQRPVIDADNGARAKFFIRRPQQYKQGKLRQSGQSDGAVGTIDALAAQFA